MEVAAPHVVFDCNIYFQALIGPSGPAGECLHAAQRNRIVLYLTNQILAELNDVCRRPKVATKFGITAARLEQYQNVLRTIGLLVHDVPHVFTYQRDPQDEHYIDLAIATHSELVVSRDRDLLALMDASDPVGHDFITRFPDIRIVTPVDLLAELANT